MFEFILLGVYALISVEFVVFMTKAAGSGWKKYVAAVVATVWPLVLAGVAVSGAIRVTRFALTHLGRLVGRSSVPMRAAASRFMRTCYLLPSEAEAGEAVVDEGPVQRPRVRRARVSPVATNNGALAAG